jgi:hypothetical protein
MDDYVAIFILVGLWYSYTQMKQSADTILIDVSHSSTGCIAHVLVLGMRTVSLSAASVNDCRADRHSGTWQP